MRLVTYDRGGARRLGAWVEDTVVDLPDAVGHPAFPSTMEALVAGNGGSLLDAARDALQRPDYWRPCVVEHPHLLAPIIPMGAGDGESPPDTDGPEATGRPRSETSSGSWSVPWLLGPADRVPWPTAGTLDYELELACIIGRQGRTIAPEDALRHVFGYTLVVGWRWIAPPPVSGRAEDSPNDGPATYAGASLGPCIVTVDEFEPSASTLTFSVDGRVRSKGGFDGAPWSFGDLIAHLSNEEPLSAGEAIGSGTFPGGRGTDVGVRLRPGAVVGAGATGIGTFVVPLERASEPSPATAPSAADRTGRARLRLLRAVPDLAARGR
jgi:hypothetical protein